MKNKKSSQIKIDKLSEKEKKIKNNLRSILMSMIFFLGIFFYDHRENSLSVLNSFVKENLMIIFTAIMIVFIIRYLRELIEIRRKLSAT